MRSFKRILAVYIAAALLFTSLPAIPGVFADGVLNVGLSVSGSDVTLTWNHIDNATDYDVVYRDSAGVLKTVSVSGNTGKSYVETIITGLSKDFIYQFKVKPRNGSVYMASPAPVTKKALVGVSLTAQSLGDTAVSLQGGGKEIGANPGLKFRIKIPQKWNGDDVENASGAVDLYDDFDKLDYDITLGTDNNALNLTKLKVRYSSNVTGTNPYIVTRLKSSSELRTVSELVYSNDPSAEPGWIVFSSWGTGAYDTSDGSYAANSNYPSAASTGFHSSNVEDIGTGTGYDLSKIYKNPDITPGTVYKMNVMPIYHGTDSADQMVIGMNAVTTGYAYTGMRFQIAKSTSNDLLVTVFKVNQSGRAVGERQTFTYEVLYSSSKDTISNDNNILRKSSYPESIILGASQSDTTSATTDKMTFFVESKDANTTFYYRVIAKAPVADQWLLSNVLDFKIADEEAKAPLPEDVRVLKTTSKSITINNTFYGTSPDPAETHDVKSGDVTLLWKNSGISDSNLYYHIMLSPAQEESAQLETIGNIFGDAAKSSKYAIKYREVLKVNANAVTPCDENGQEMANGEYLKYTIKMSPDRSVAAEDYQLFRVIGSDGKVEGVLPNTKLTGDDFLYPTYLIPNKVYYVKMYSQKDTNPVSAPSDLSIPAAFTINVSEKKNPPSPMNFFNSENVISSNGVNTVSFQWSTVDINLTEYTSAANTAYDLYYDLYISDGLNSSGGYLKLGSAKRKDPSKIGDVTCTGQEDVRSTVIGGTVSAFSLPELVSRFGGSLKPNTTYYFKIKTRLVIKNTADSTEETRESSDSNIIAVTTLRGSIVDPGEEEAGPKLPENFEVAEDNTSTSDVVKLVWDEMEKSTDAYDIKYSLIQTSRSLDSNEDDITVIRQIDTNMGYYNLVEHLTSNVQDGTNAKFTYSNGKFYYQVTGLKPNTIYYFSLRAEKDVKDPAVTDPAPTVWITLPVTTTLIETPLNLQIVGGHEIGASWTAGSALDPEDFTVSISKGGRSYTTVSNGQKSVSEVVYGNGTSIFFVRVTGLEPNSTYSLRVYASKEVSSGTVTSDETITGLTTRDPQHSIDVKWKGRESYTYELAIKGEDEIGTVQLGSTSTTIKLSSLANANSDHYNNLVVEITSGTGSGQQRTITGYNGSSKVAEVDKAWSVTPDNTSHYKIYTEYSVLTEGAGFAYTSSGKTDDLLNSTYKMYYARIPKLKANTKYYIKVRSMKDNERSKYCEPVSTRTEFSQDDYDDEEDDNNENTSYFDLVRKFKKSLYWMLGTSSGTFKAKVRRDMAESYIKSNPGNTFVLEFLEEEDQNRKVSAVYVPVAVMELLSERNTSLVVKVPGAEYNFRPNTLDYANSEEISELEDDDDVKEVYLYIEIEKQGKSKGPAGSKSVSDIHEVNVEAVGTDESDADIEKAIKEKIDEYIADGLADLKDTDDDDKDTADELAEVINEIAEKVEERYRDFIEDYFEGGGGYSSVIEDSENIDGFHVPVNVRMVVDVAVKGPKSGYVGAGSSWTKVPSNTVSSGSIVSFDFSEPEELGVFCIDVTTLYNIPYSHWAKNDITSFASKYDLTDVFTGGANFDGSLSVYNTIILIEKVMTAGKDEGTEALQDKAKKLGMDGVISYGAPGRSITRQEMAALTIKVYELKTGIEIGMMRTKKTIFIKDAQEIKNNYYKPVELSVDMDITSLDSGRNFKPKENCSGAQVITVLTRLLKILGEL